MQRTELHYHLSGHAGLYSCLSAKCDPSSDRYIMKTLVEHVSAEELVARFGTSRHVGRTELLLRNAGAGYQKNSTWQWGTSSEGDQHPHDDALEGQDDICVCGDPECPGYEEQRTYCIDREFDGIKSNPDQRDGNVGELIDGRVDVYGDPVTGFIRHAQVWSGILGIEVHPWQVALCMIGYKLVRTSITPDYSDNSDDVDGYLDIFKQLIGDDMVQARDTAAYLAGGGKGARS